MSLEKLRPSFTFTEDRLRELQAVVPEAFADGKINWDVLSEALGEQLEEETQEHFGLTWPSKREARRLAAMPSKGSLMPMIGQGVNEETTHNIFIEGDNLEVLKLLQKSYAGRVKMIYIDPPYNTGNDFVYSDNYSEPLDSYLLRTGQMNEAGRKLSSNSRSGGRYHTNWLNLMYPRLLIARQLLRDDGVIFISIDDNEVHYLRQIMAEIFGEECFVSQITILCNPKGRSQDKFFATNHEYIVVYSKNPLQKGTFSIEKEIEQIENEYPEEDEGGKFRLLELRNTHREFGKSNRPNLYYPFYVHGDGIISLEQVIGSESVWPVWEDGFEGCWTWEARKARNEIEFLAARIVNSRWKIYRKNYASGAERMLKTIFLDKSFFTEKGQQEFNQLFNTKDKIFQSPKSPFLISQLIQISTSSEDIILDFFAGSCTTAQAVLLRNKDDGFNRKFIVVQLPEPTKSDSIAYQAGYSNIAEIGKERIRRVIKKMNNDYSEQLILSPFEDLGFAVFRLDRSQFKYWQPYSENNLTQLGSLFDQFESPLKAGWQAKNLIPEILLLQGFPLDATIRQLPALQENTVKEVSHDFCAHQLYICLDEKITEATIKAIQIHPEDIFVCLDSALTDEAKISLSDRCNLKVI